MQPVRIQLELELLTPLISEGAIAISLPPSAATGGQRRAVGPRGRERDEIIDQVAPERRPLLLDNGRNPAYMKHALEAALLLLCRTIGIRDDAESLKAFRTLVKPVLGLGDDIATSPSRVRFGTTRWKSPKPHLTLAWFRYGQRDRPTLACISAGESLLVNMVVPQRDDPAAELFWIGLLAWTEYLGSARRHARGFGSFRLVKVKGDAPSWVSTVHAQRVESPSERVTRVYEELATRLLTIVQRPAKNGASFSFLPMDSQDAPRMFVAEAPGANEWKTGSQARRALHLELYRQFKTGIQRGALGTGYSAQRAITSALSFAPKSDHSRTWAVVLCRPSEYLTRGVGPFSWSEFDSFLATVSEPSRHLIRLTEVPLLGAGSTST